MRFFMWGTTIGIILGFGLGWLVALRSGAASQVIMPPSQVMRGFEGQELLAAVMPKDAKAKRTSGGDVAPQGSEPPRWMSRHYWASWTDNAPADALNKKLQTEVEDLVKREGGTIRQAGEFEQGRSLWWSYESGPLAGVIQAWIILEGPQRHILLHATETAVEK